MSTAVLEQEITVDDLVRTAEWDNQRFKSVTLGEHIYTSEFTHDSLTVAGQAIALDVDTNALRVLGDFLTIPGSYLKRTPPELREVNVRHYLDEKAGENVLFETSDDGNLVSIFSADTPTFPRQHVAQIIADVFQGNGTVRRANLQNGLMSVDVSTAAVTESRPRNPGEVTEGGVRVHLHMKPKETHITPYVATYMHVLDCSNGMYHQEERGKIQLRGKTVEEVLDELEGAAQFLLNDVVPDRLEQFEQLDHITVDNVEQYVHRITKEHGISSKVKDEILSETSSLENHSLYEVLNLITGMQNEDIRASQVDKLMALGGSVVAKQYGHRCAQCQRVLD